MSWNASCKEEVRKSIFKAFDTMKGLLTEKSMQTKPRKVFPNILHGVCCYIVE